MIIATNDQGVVLCGWFAMCDRPAAGVVAHPVLGPVPTCEPCATDHDLDLEVGTVTLVGTDEA